MSTVGLQTARYYEWLRSSAEQARKNQKTPDRALVLAACQLKGAWILSGCSKVDRIEFQYTHFHEYPEVYKELVDKIEDHAHKNCVPPGRLEKAREEAEKLTLPEILAISSIHGIFEAVAPNLVIVMDVMQR